MPVSALTTLLAVVPLILPEVAVIDVNARGCGTPVLVLGADRVPLELPSDALCVHKAFAARLEPGAAVQVVLLVHLVGEAGDDQRLFIYTLRGRRLEPRYLGSGPRGAILLDAGRVALPSADALQVDIVDREGRGRHLRCWFEGFPLQCRDDRSPEAGP